MTDDAMIEKIARAIAQSDGLDFDEVCGVDADPDEGYCDSGTCVAAHFEEHDAAYARSIYRHQAQAAAAVLSEAMAEREREIAGYVEKLDLCGAEGWVAEAIASGQWKEPT